MDDIDFVITWVNGSDRAWLEEKSRYNNEKNLKKPFSLLQTYACDMTDGIDDSKERYRDWGFLRYWFRCVERFAPWVRKVHFVTWGHLPKWLDTEHPKLEIVRHEDYIPKEYLPVFNSTVLEIWMHKIPGLSERFVYFNDDMFLTGKMGPDMFFHEGLPCDMLAFQPVVANPSNPVMSYRFLNNALILSKYFDKRTEVRRHPGNYFKVGYPPLYFLYNLLEMAFPRYTGFYTIHGPSPFLKSTFLDVWSKEEAFFLKMSYDRFRSKEDVNQYLFREWQKLSGNFYPMNIAKQFCYFDVTDSKAIAKCLLSGKKKCICINDQSMEQTAMDNARQNIIQAFERLVPEPSAFENDRRGVRIHNAV